MRFKVNIILVVLFIFTSVHSLHSQDRKELRLGKKIEKKLKDYPGYFNDHIALGKFKLINVRVNRKQKKIDLHLSSSVSNIPLREYIIADEECAIKEHLGWSYRKYGIELYADTTKLVDLVPNYYRSILPIDTTHFALPSSSKKTLYKRLFDEEYKAGLHGNHIALWHSHGRYYESKLDRWEWQRARIHTTVEDILPMAFVLPYISKMLENAGAITFIPRERDFSIFEHIVDNDKSSDASELLLNQQFFHFEKIDSAGFGWHESYSGIQNPFKMGSYLNARARNYIPDEELPVEVATYVPFIKNDGNYALYISYGNDNDLLSQVKYVVRSQNGVHEYLVDQSMASNTWIYLGHFDFAKGINQEFGSVSVYSLEAASVVSIDAIKIGGGMGNIARRPSKYISEKNKSDMDTDPAINRKINKNFHDSISWKRSGMPRYMEAARYFLQYSGMPDSIVYNLNDGSNDYNDDYQSRGEWVNFLMGRPNGPSDHRDVKGLGVPIDLTLSFHTDAGVTENDSIIGTLAIYSSKTDDGFFPSGQSRESSRAITDMIQSEIVDDIRKLYNPEWTRRGIWNKTYSEAYRANVPGILLELLSHQNLADMEYALDPRFRFSSSRSIYKGILKYLHFQAGTEPVVQPLPVDHFGMEKLDSNMIRLSWKEVSDPLEASAKADYYKIEMRKGNGGFIMIADSIVNTSYTHKLEEWNEIYSFRVTAVNKGGKSFPSEILAAGFVNEEDNDLALVVNAFDRLSGPSIIDRGDHAGVSIWDDQGVADKFDYSFVGAVYDFDRNSVWLDDDSPGWGASHADWEGRKITGNTFDNVFLHGQSLLDNGISFISSSDEYFTSSDGNNSAYSLVDLLYGEEKTTPVFNSGKSEFQVFSPEMQEKIRELKAKGVPLFISGAYIGSDHIIQKDSLSKEFVEKELHFKWRSNFADRMGWVYGTDLGNKFRRKMWMYNSGYHPEHYTVEAPDAIEAADSRATSILRYGGSNSSAGVGYKSGDHKLLSVGFPFESIPTRGQRQSFMKTILEYLEIL